MSWKNTPALAPALGLSVGCATASHLGTVALGWLLALAILGVGLRRPAGLALTALAVGWWLQGIELENQRRFAATIEKHRPLVLEGVVVSHGMVDEEGWRSLVRARRAEQDDVWAIFEDRVWIRGPGLQRPTLGQQLRLKGYLRRGSSYGNGPSRTLGPWSLTVKSPRLMTAKAPGHPVWGLAVAMRNQVEEACRTWERRGKLGAHGGGWLRALLLGDRSGLPLAEQQALRRHGLAHLLAVSGLHLVLVFGGIHGLLFALPWRWRLSSAGLGMLAYASLLGAQASVMRAAAMLGLTLLACFLSRPPEPRNALAVTVIVLLLQDPGWIDDLGFRLSVSATAGLLWWTPWLMNMSWKPWCRLPPWLRGSLAASLAAQAATFPWVLPLHGGIHPLAPWVHLLALPWLAAFLLCALAAMVVAWIPGGLAMGRPVGWCLDTLAEAPRLLAQGPVGAWSWQPWDERWIFPILWILGTWVAFYPLRRSRLPGWLLLLVLLLIQGRGAISPTTPELMMIDVGQGDALLLRDGEHTLLVDGGGWRRGDFGGRVLLPLMASLGIDRLQAVMLTHGDTDHCAGVRDLLHYLPVSEVWAPADATRGECMGRALAVAGPRWRPLWRGDVLTLGRWRLRVLHPQPGGSLPGNDGSLVVQATVHDRRVLLTGDLEAAGERALVKRYGEDLASDVLKVAHHGSKTSTMSSFVNASRPRLALISSGVDNRYGHPAGLVVERLRGVGAVVLRTDHSGLVRLGFPEHGPLEIRLPASPRAVLPSGSR